MAAFAITTNDYTFSTTTPQTFDCYLRSGGAQVQIFVNNVSYSAVLPSGSSFNFINLSDIKILRFASTQNFNLVCAYQPTEKSQIIVEATTTLPADLINSTYLITGLLIFGFIIFISYLVFRYLRF
jgi:hypothetical protein